MGNTVRLYFVRGHQEAKKAKSDLDHDEQMNILADSLTRKARKLQPQQSYHKVSTTSVDLEIHKHYITGHYPYHMLAAYHSI
jgi:transposase